MSEFLTYLQNNEPQFRKARLAALYSDFRHLSSTNPDGYSANIEAWRKGLAAGARAGVIPTRASASDLLSVTVDQDLLRALDTKEWGRPLALGTVIREAIEKKEMILWRDFIDSQESIYARSWAIRPWGILKWGLKQLGLAGGHAGEDQLLVSKVVILENLEEAGKETVKRFAGIRGRVERIFSRAEFSEKFGNVFENSKKLSDDDMELLLRYLARDKGLISYDTQLVKLKAPNEASPSAITSEDQTIVSLTTLIKDMEIQTDVLTRRVDELSVAAKEAVSRKNRVAALAALRSKKLAETTLTKRHATLSQLEEVFSKIEQAADQIELVRVMEASTKVLTGLNKEVGGVERVDDVVDQLREQMTQVDEVGNVIAEVGQQSGAVDETEVDDELEAMEREERAKVEEKERKEQEERENREAAETKRKLDALEETERRAKDAAEKQAASSHTEDGIVENTQGIRGLSLEQSPTHIAA